MSAYSFIAADYELPEVDNPKGRIITVAEAVKLGIKPHKLVPWEEMAPHDEILFFDHAGDLGELTIKRSTVCDEYIRMHTDKPFVYSVCFEFTEQRVWQLHGYLIENTRPGCQIELWSIWLGDVQRIDPMFCEYDRFSLADIKQVFDYRSEDYQRFGCLIISR